MRGCIRLRSAGRMGRGVKIAVLDSGINPLHSHVRPVEGGVSIALNESGQPVFEEEFFDYVGHGTACAGVIRLKAPEARIFAVKVLDAELRCHARQVAEGIRWSVTHGMKIVNVSLGTDEEEHREEIRSACNLAANSGVIIIASGPSPDKPAYPAWFPEVIGVGVSESVDPWTLEFIPDSILRFRACNLPRPIPGVPVERNFKGVSFSAAHVTSLAALIVEENPDASVEEVRRGLAALALDLV